MAYAVLGATGQVGGCVVDVLTKDHEKKINLFVRSQDKLYNQRPQLADAQNVQVYEGTMQDVNTLADCLSDTRGDTHLLPSLEMLTGPTAAAFLCIAENRNKPGCDVAQQQAKSVVNALQTLRGRDSQARLPMLVMLSSASTDAHMMRDFPAIPYWFLKSGMSYVYADLEKAESYLRSQDWVKQVYVKPGGLSQVSFRVDKSAMFY
jgi:hypothetical protein